MSTQPNTTDIAKGIYVYRDCALVYETEIPNWYGCLAVSTLRGGMLAWQNCNVWDNNRTCFRPATRADFDAFRVHDGGYEFEPSHSAA